MKSFNNLTVFIFILVISLFTSCSNSSQDDTTPKPIENQRIVDTTTANFKAKKFIYGALRWGYVFKDDVPDLRNNRFSSQRNFDFYIDDFDSPESLWENLIVTEDRFSALFSDLDSNIPFSRLEFEFRFFEATNNEINIVVTRVEKNSNAELIGIKRGMIFNKINGTPIDRNNQIDFFTLNSFELEEAILNDNNNIESTGNTFTITKSNTTENPIGNFNLIDIENHRIAYLQFNTFLFPPYDEELNKEFGFLQNQGITDFVLDLRFNSGGSVDTANRLISLLTGQFTDEILSFSTWNTLRQAELRRENINNVVTRFPSTTFDNEIPLNSLGLTKIYVLTSKDLTASASELVINTLKPYIDVVVIGDSKGTAGKSRASVRIFDKSDNELTFDFDEAGSEHNYYMQPLVYQLSNKNRVAVSENGIQPNIVKTEDFSNLGILGDANEPLLKAAIDDILGNSQLNAKSLNLYKLGNDVGNSQEKNPNYQRMYHRSSNNTIKTLPNI